MKTHPILQQLGIEKVYVDEENPVTNAPDSMCLILKDGHALVLNQIEKDGRYEGTEVVLWKGREVMSVVVPVKGVEQ